MKESTWEERFDYLFEEFSRDFPKVAILMKGFFKQVEQEAYERGKKVAIYDLQQEMQDEQDKFLQGFSYKKK